MLSIDLRNAFEWREDNFTCGLLRLIAKADGTNRVRLGREYPAEVLAVEIYQGDCPYVDEAKNEVNWEEIARRATERKPLIPDRKPTKIGRRD